MQQKFLYQSLILGNVGKMLIIYKGKRYFVSIPNIR